MSVSWIAAAFYHLAAAVKSNIGQSKMKPADNCKTLVVSCLIISAEKGLGVADMSDNKL